MGTACQHAYWNQDNNIYKRWEKKIEESPNQQQTAIKQNQIQRKIKAIEINVFLLRFYNFVCHKYIGYLLTYFFREYHFIYPFIFYSIAENVGQIEKGIRTVKNKG